MADVFIHLEPCGLGHVSLLINAKKRQPKEPETTSFTTKTTHH